MLETFDVVKDKDHAVAGGQGGDGTFQRHAVDRAGQHGVAAAEVAFWRVFLGWADGLFERDQVQTLLAQVHQDEIDRQAVQPGGEGALAAEAADLTEQVEEGLLGHVFRLGDIAEHAQTEGVDAALVQGIKLRKRLGIAQFGRFDCFGLPCDGRISFEQAGVRLLLRLFLRGNDCVLRRTRFLLRHLG